MKKSGFTHESTYNESKEWYTPRYIFDALGLQFDMDVCSPGADLVPWIPAKKHLTILDDGLTARWEGLVWMNPPYGMDTPKWMKRLKEHGSGLGLVFARPDTGWFHEYAAEADAILFIRKRVQFIQAKQAEKYAKRMKIKNSGSGAGSMLVAFGEKSYRSLCDCDGELGTMFIRNSIECPCNTELQGTVRTEQGFGSGGPRSYENFPRNADVEQGQLF